MPYAVTDQVVRHELFAHGGYQNVSNEVQLSTANLRLCYSWIAEASKTLAGIRVPITNVTGTLTNGLTWNVYAGDSAGLPTGASLASGTVTPGAAFTTSTLAPTNALTAGTRYCLVIQNVLGVPASNWFALPYGSSLPQGMNGIASISTDGGTTYNDRIPMMPAIQLSYSDTSRYGPACAMPISLNTTGHQLYSSSGSRFSLAGVRFQPHYRRGICEVVGRFRLVGVLGSAGALACRIYNGTTLLATSDNTCAYVTAATAGYASFFFGTPLIIDPSMVIAVTFGQSAATGGDVSNHWLAAGNTSTKYAPTGIADCTYEGWHTVTSTASALSAWTVGGDAQVYAAIMSRVVSNRRYF